MKVLMLCLGNICRSPMAEVILRKKLVAAGITSCEVASAGTNRWHKGGPADPRAVAACSRRGIDLRSHIARRVTAKDFEDFDVIYCMAPDVTEELRELVRGTAVDFGKVRLFLDELGAERGRPVPDPWYGEDSAFDECFDLLERTCEQIVRRIRGSEHRVGPEHTAVRVALWRALHSEVDPAPHVFFDRIGLELAGERDWRSRPDMEPDFSKPMRASIVARARFVEDWVEKRLGLGAEQFVILGAGLDTFAQRRADLVARLRVFEIDQPAPQEWKRKRLREIGAPIPDSLRFVPVDFEARESWWDRLIDSGFDAGRPSAVVSTGVSMYLTEEANQSTLDRLAGLAPGSSFAMTFLLPPELLSPKERATMEFVMKRAQEAGTPFRSLFDPEKILKMAELAGFREAQYVSADDLHRLYFAGRSDGLHAGQAEAFLVAST